MKTVRKTKKHLSETLFESVLDRIISGEYPPGQIISEKDLCQEFNVSRTPFREAIRKLEEMHMVEVVPRFGTYVTEIDINEVTAAFEVRLYMEVVAAKLAAERRTDKQLDAMKALVNDAKSIKGGMTWHDKRNFDRRLHEIIWEASHNHILAKTLTNLKLTCTRINTSFFANSISEEDGIALLSNAHRLMEDQDHAGLESLIHEHMLATVEHLKNYIFSKFTKVNMERRHEFGT
ncbi:MAG: GntR family transcriptional regulator [bacterium]|nr:GntR family transcriptional regulator [bacterium]